MAAGGGDTTASLSRVTDGWGTPNATTNQLGTFSVRTAAGKVTASCRSGIVQWKPGFRHVQWLNQHLAGGPAAARAGLPDVNVSFFMLAPPFQLTAAFRSPNMLLSFPTQTGFKYQVQYKSNLTDATWTALGSPVPGDGTVKSVNDLISSSRRFYTVVIQ